MTTTQGSRLWAVTLTLVLVVTLAVTLVVGVLRMAQLLSVPLGAPIPIPAPAQGAGPSTVELSADAAAHPAATAVRDLLTRHFAAINAKNYPAWANTVTQDRVVAQPEPAWRQAYGSTTGGTIRVSRIDEQAAGRLVALVFYVSTQRPESAPDDLREPRICWRVAITMVGDPPSIDVSRTASLLRGRC